MIKHYSNGEITVTWKPNVCQHSGRCFGHLLPVFDPRRKPWIVMENGTTEQIIHTVNLCPSHALSFNYNNDGESKKKKNSDLNE